MGGAASGLLLEFLSSEGLKFSLSVRYSGRFKPYNANVRKSGSHLEFNLSREWKSVSDEIVLGLLQSLAARILRAGFKTANMDIYNNFVRSLHLSYPKAATDPCLAESFRRVNSKYFDGLLEITNFAWHSSLRRLASYDYQTDTISVSGVFRGMDELIDYLIYHELLHKKLKYHNAGGRSIHHSAIFRQMERKFENQELIERQISRMIRNQKFKY
ncbi:M48 family metallopeptidase [Candidatus Woesearchaeota archaeon]|nr:M48 family metallopeptidase [Candidatus Woesearchaeota archaeon]